MQLHLGSNVTLTLLIHFQNFEIWKLSLQRLLGPVNWSGCHWVGRKGSSQTDTSKNCFSFNLFVMKMAGIVSICLSLKGTRQSTLSFLTFGILPWSICFCFDRKLFSTFDAISRAKLFAFPQCSKMSSPQKRRWCRRRRQWRRRYRSDVVFDVCRNCSDVLLVRRIGPKENNFSDTLLIAGNGCSHV